MRKTKRALAAGAALATGMVLLPSTPASAAGGRCDGNQVRTCVSVGIKDGYIARANASVTDVKGDGLNFSVRTTKIRLQVWNGRSWVTRANANDYDGWHAYRDVGHSGRRYCNGTGYLWVRARAHFDWKRVGTSGQWMNSKAVRIPCVLNV